MAGISRLAAVKLILSSGILVSGGAGVYHFTSGGGAPIWSYFADGAPRGTLEAEADQTTSSFGLKESNANRARLDELANAWKGMQSATPTSSESVKYPEDRYAIAVEPARDEPAAEAIKNTEPQAKPNAANSAVTRGQAPEEFAAEVKEYQPSGFEPGETATPSMRSSERAREAFDASTSASARYRDAAAAATSSNPPVNPFGGLPTPSSLDRPSSAAEVVEQPRSPQTSEPPTGATPLSNLSRGATDNELRTASSSLNAGGDSYRPSDTASLGNTEMGTSAEGTGRPGERALEGVQKPALLIQKIAPPEIKVGAPAKIAIQLRNVGAQTAEEVVIRDEVPSGTRYISSTPKAELEGNFIVWQLGSLSTGEERTVELQLMPLAEGEIGSVANVTYATQASAKSRCTMPQLAIRMTAPAKVMIGHEQRVKIELRNPGTGDATNVMLLENVPDGVRHAAGPALEFEVGTLKAGETREMELVLTAERAGQVVNTLSARADGNLQVQQQVEFEVIAPELSVAVEGPERRYLERPATYQVIVENPGTAPAHDVELVSKLPKGMQFVRANNMGEYDAATHSVYWSLAQLPEGERGTVELVAMPIEPGQQTLTIQGKAQQGLADETRQDIVIEGLAAIMFEVRDSQDPIEVGGETSYEIRVVNQGTKAATNVQVVVTLPAGMQAMSADGETRYSVQAGGVVFEPLPQLAPKADTIYRVQVKGVQPGDQRITVQVNTDDISQPIRREESTRVFGDE
jgi:uncharacterized repeat protein (TIGR01451 family)